MTKSFSTLFLYVFLISIVKFNNAKETSYANDESLSNNRKYVNVKSHSSCAPPLYHVTAHSANQKNRMCCLTFYLFYYKKDKQKKFTSLPCLFIMVILNFFYKASSTNWIYCFFKMFHYLFFCTGIPSRFPLNIDDIIWSCRLGR